MEELLISTFPLSSYAEGLNIAVTGPFAKDAYVKMGDPAEKVFVIGQPEFALLFQEKLDKD